MYLLSTLSVARIGAAVNAMAATENGGGLVADGELVAVLEAEGQEALAVLAAGKDGQLAATKVGALSKAQLTAFIDQQLA